MKSFNTEKMNCKHQVFDLTHIINRRLVSINMEIIRCNINNLINRYVT